MLLKLSTLTKHDRAEYRAHTQRVRKHLRAIARKPSPAPPQTITRRRVPRDQVQEKTEGNCHMCGDSLGGEWQVGHVKPYQHGGRCTVKNCLPICIEYNRLRWSYSPNVLR